MTYNQKNIGDAWVAILTIIGALLICLCITLLTGCRTRYITQEIPVVLHDRDSIVSVQHIHTHDTLIYRDSVYHYVKGDTILIEKWHTMQAINKVARVDTLVKVEQKEVPVPYPKPYPVEKGLSWWQKMLIWCGAFAIGIGGGLMYWKFRR